MSNKLHSTKSCTQQDLGLNFQNFPKIFSKDLPMPDNLEIPKKFSFPKFQRLSLRFQRTSFLIFLN